MIESPALGPQPAAPARQGILYVISAPSGAGKTSLCKELKRLCPELCQSISYTTRAVRPGEQNGVDYHFVTAATFAQMVRDGEFAEWAEVHGNRYGTAKETLRQALQTGRDLLLDIDFQGAAQLRESGMDGVFIFILPPDMDELRRRLKGRNTDSDAVIERRMTNARGEIAQAAQFDYLVVNDRFAEALAKLRAILVAEANRTGRVLPGLSAQFRLK